MEEFREFLKEHPYIPGLLMMVLGVVLGWLLGRWRRHRLKRQVSGGDMRELIAIEQILVREQPDGRTTMRIRSCGSAPVQFVLTNPVALEEFERRARATRPANPLMDMSDKFGSFLLHLLQPWVCGSTYGSAFPHDIWVMAPVCEPSLLSSYQTATVLLVRQEDLQRFLDWEQCKRLQVEHGSDGARILTLWHVARAWEKQVAEVRRRRQAGESTAYTETMYLLDLALDTQEAPLPTKPVSWSRFDKTLRELGLTA